MNERERGALLALEALSTAHTSDLRWSIQGLLALRATKRDILVVVTALLEVKDVRAERPAAAEEDGPPGRGGIRGETP